jgi:hypothetical protein
MRVLEAKDIIYGLSILLTFALGVWNLVSNYRTSRRTSFINTVTAQRVKWIEQLRQDISVFSGLTHLIRLRLNPSGTHDKEIEELLRRIPQLTHVAQRDELKQALEQHYCHHSKAS